MAVSLIRAGVIENVAEVTSLEDAAKLYPDHIIVERTEENQHLQIGDAP